LPAVIKKSDRKNRPAEGGFLGENPSLMTAEKHGKTAVSPLCLTPEMRGFVFPLRKPVSRKLQIFPPSH
jgi:hypothetical protein